jgi:hypothetical protein
VSERYGLEELQRVGRGLEAISAQLHVSTTAMAIPASIPTCFACSGTLIPTSLLIFVIIQYFLFFLLAIEFYFMLFVDDDFGLETGVLAVAWSLVVYGTFAGSAATPPGELCNVPVDAVFCVMLWSPMVQEFWFQVMDYCEDFVGTIWLTVGVLDWHREVNHRCVEMLGRLVMKLVRLWFKELYVGRGGIDWRRLHWLAR